MKNLLPALISHLYFSKLLHGLLYFFSYTNLFHHHILCRSDVLQIGWSWDPKSFPHKNDPWPYLPYSIGWKPKIKQVYNYIDCLVQGTDYCSNHKYLPWNWIPIFNITIICFGFVTIYCTTMMITKHQKKPKKNEIHLLMCVHQDWFDEEKKLSSINTQPTKMDWYVHSCIPVLELIQHSNISFKLVITYCVRQYLVTSK